MIERQTKYAVLNQNANQIAQVILFTITFESLKPNSDGDWIVAVCMKHSDHLVTTLLGIWKAGASYLPIDVEYPENRIDHIMKEAKPVLVIYDDNFVHCNFFHSVKSFKFGELKRLAHRMPIENILPDNMLTKGDLYTKAITIYTSGSAGSPKGVRLRHHTFLNRILWELETFPFIEVEKHCVFKTTLTFIDHVAELWCPLLSGCSVVIVPKPVVANPELFATLLENYQIRRLNAVPTFLFDIFMHLNMLESNKTKFMLANLKIWHSSGEKLTLELIETFFDYYNNGKYVLANTYGCTEDSSDSTWIEFQSIKQLKSYEKIPVGTPVPNAAILILDENGEVMREGEVGEICCAGAIVSDGYVNGKTSKAFDRNPHSSEYRKFDLYLIFDST